MGMEQADQCQQAECTSTATVMVFWPGQTTRQCIIHAASLQNLASHMGFTLSVLPIRLGRSAEG